MFSVTIAKVVFEKSGKVPQNFIGIEKHPLPNLPKLQNFSKKFENFLLKKIFWLCYEFSLLRCCQFMFTSTIFSKIWNCWQAANASCDRLGRLSFVLLEKWPMSKLNLHSMTTSLINADTHTQAHIPLHLFPNNTSFRSLIFRQSARCCSFILLLDHILLIKTPVEEVNFPSQTQLKFLEEHVIGGQVGPGNQEIRFFLFHLLLLPGLVFVLRKQFLC